MNPHMKWERDGAIFSNVIIETWCSEVLSTKSKHERFYSRMKYPVWEESGEGGGLLISYSYTHYISQMQKKSPVSRNLSDNLSPPSDQQLPKST